MIEALKKQALQMVRDCRFDTLAVGLVDFSKKNVQSFQIFQGQEFSDFNFQFDIASLTKPLTLGLSYLKSPELFSASMLLLLNHQGSLKSWARLSPRTWRELLLSYPIAAAETCYSDLGALRLMLEIEKKLGHSLYEFVAREWDQEIQHWSEGLDKIKCPPTGYRAKSLIQGEVHDDNAFNLKEKLAHAGLFATIDGIGRTLLNLDARFKLLERQSELLSLPNKSRFAGGWDTPSDPQSSLAGAKASALAFGHLGFTGTSIWIDPVVGKAIVILSNATQRYWYAREDINGLRRSLGTLAFSANS